MRQKGSDAGAGREVFAVADVVLLIDSDADECSILQRALKARGYAVLTAPNPSEAIATASKDGKPIQLVLVDAQCTGKQLDFLTEQTSVLGAQPAVLVMSTNDEDAQQTLHQIVRPFTPSELARRVSTLLGKDVR